MSHESLLLSALATLSNNEHQQYDDTVWCHGLDHSHHSMYHSIPSIVDVTICHVIYFHSALTTQSASAWWCSCVPQIAPYHHVTISRRVFQLKATTWKKYTNTNTKTQLQKNAQIFKHTHTNTEQQHTVFPISYPPHRKNTQIQKHGLHHLIPSVNRSSRPPRGKSTRPATHSQSDNQTT